MNHLAAILLAIVPHLAEPVVRCRVERCEVNHVFDGQGAYQFTQLIFDDGRDEIYGWCYLVERGGVRHDDRRPKLVNRKHVCEYIDEGIPRRIECGVILETLTNYDREFAARERVSPCDRRGLGGRAR